jgi:hypothetical protein
MGSEATRAAEIEATETISGVLTDLMEVAERLAVPAEKAETVARILDRLAEEIAEAAAMLRTPGTRWLNSAGNASSPSWSWR